MSSGFRPQTKDKVWKVKMIEVYVKRSLKKDEKGIMIKQAESAYCDGRSSLMLKLKPSFDDEGVIVDYTKEEISGSAWWIRMSTSQHMDTYHVIDQVRTMSIPYLVWMIFRP